MKHRLQHLAAWLLICFLVLSLFGALTANAADNTGNALPSCGKNSLSWR